MCDTERPPSVVLRFGESRRLLHLFQSLVDHLVSCVPKDEMKVFIPRETCCLSCNKVLCEGRNCTVCCDLVGLRFLCQKLKWFRVWGWLKLRKFLWVFLRLGHWRHRHWKRFWGRIYINHCVLSDTGYVHVQPAERLGPSWYKSLKVLFIMFAFVTRNHPEGWKLQGHISPTTSKHLNKLTLVLELYMVTTQCTKGSVNFKLICCQFGGWTKIPTPTHSPLRSLSLQGDCNTSWLVSGLDFRISGFRIRVSGSGFRVQNSEPEREDMLVKWGCGFRISGYIMKIHILYYDKVIIV